MELRINLKEIQSHRAWMFNLPPGKPLTSAHQALNFVNQRGFVYFWRITGVDLPSLWVAAAGDRPVAEKHDDPGHITWGWKDNALDKKIWYYAKILRGKATIIALDIAPYFYALSENYGSPEEDYLITYHEGRLPQSAKQIYEALLEKGALNTLDLRKAAKLSNAKDSEFNKALEYLQRDFKILPVGVAQAGAWKYSHIYEIVTRFYPRLSEQAREITESQARMKILQLYFNMVGAAQPRDAVKLFGWSTEVVHSTIDKMSKEGLLVKAEHPRKNGEWVALPKICQSPIGR